MTSLTELNEFLARLKARRLRVSDLAEHGRVRDAEELIDEVTELGEQLLVADEELRTQQEALADARLSLEIVAVRNEELFEASSSAYVITDLDGRIVRTNRSAAALIADTPARAVVRPFPTRFVVGDRPTIRSMISQAGAIDVPGARFTSAATLLQSDGTAVPVTVSVRADRTPSSLTPSLLWELAPGPRPSSEIRSAGASEVASPSANAVVVGAPPDALMPDVDATLVAPVDLATGFAVDGVPTELLDVVVEMAVDTVPGAEHAGISLLRPGQPIETVAATSELVDRCDQAQYELGEGPSLRAIENATGVLVVDDMRIEELWPRFAARAVDLGVYSLLACRLSTAGSTIGVLTMLASQPRAFDDASVVMCAAFAAHAAIAIAHAEREAYLRRAIESREAIGPAMGILMERYGLAAGAAFELLVAAAQRQQVKLRDVAQHVVETGEDPGVDTKG